METNFFIKRIEGQKESPVYYMFTLNGRKIRISTGEKCNPKNWGIGEAVRNNATTGLRQLLTSNKVIIDNYIKETVAKTKVNPSKYDLHQFVLMLQGKIQPNDNSLKQLAIRFLSEINITESKPRKKITLDRKETRLNHFLNYKNYGQLVLGDINKELLYSYKAYLLSLGIENTSVNNHLKDVNSFFNWLLRQEITNIKFSEYLKKITETEKPIIALNNTELSALENAFGLNNTETKVLDLFLLSCYTGLRYSDLQRITKDMIENEFLTIRQQKTTTEVTIPLLSEPMTILKRYNYELPQMTNECANRHLKEIFQFLKLNRPVKKQSQKGGVTLDEFKPLSKVCSFHLGRKTFITLALTGGLASRMVQSISGQRSEKSFVKYISFCNEDLKQGMKKLSRSNRHLKVKAG